MVTADVSARLAWPDDAPAIARIQLAGWRAAYGELLPEELLDRLDPVDLAEQWRVAITRPSEARMRVLVALEKAEVRGFALVHPGQDPDSDDQADGEVGELVINPAHRGQGHGSRLLQAAVDTLVADGFTRARWWISTTDDRLRAFIVSSGWEADGAHRELEAVTGQSLKQVRLHTDLT